MNGDQSATTGTRGDRFVAFTLLPHGTGMIEVQEIKPTMYASDVSGLLQELTGELDNLRRLPNTCSPYPERSRGFMGSMCGAALLR